MSDYLAHFGVKGMRWGHRKIDETAPVDPALKTPMSKKKKTAIVLGSAVGVAAIAAGAYYIKKNSKVSMADVKNLANQATVDRGKKFAEASLKEPNAILHAARGKERGWHFLSDGGVDPLTEFSRAGLDGAGQGGGVNAGFFRRYGNDLEKAAVVFSDPEGRRDAATRPIHHNVMLPKHLAEGVDTYEKAVAVAWPLIKDVYAAMYNSPVRGHS